jgi:hypothetical protein
VGLRNGAAGELAPGVVVVALRARQVELPLAAQKCRFAFPEVGFNLLNCDGQSAGLAADVGGERQQLAALVGERGRLLLLDAAQVDALLEVDQLAFVQRRVAGGHALHALRAVARGAVAPPQRLAVEQPQRRRAGGLVVLHGLRLAAHELVARFAGFFAGKRICRKAKAKGGEKQRSQTTLICTDCVAA